MFSNFKTPRGSIFCLLRLACNETSLRGDEAKFYDTKEHTYSM
ncbi:hypothetical protein [Campylobacter concisus]|nr:hypothetical protein [Campylobacter concisus]